ncbi:MAG TPA: VIT and VWA domain-containing protein [Verrucomicrobiae bacterium]|nr:VIT and VWA domain-containing protein [Verrucomicrobiae bacterium]
MKRLFLLPLFVVLFGSAASALADGLIVIDKPYWPNRPHPVFPSPPYRPYAPLEITYHHVHVKINGQIATTSVDQDFYNPNPQRLEGTYLFPIPKGAQIDKFTMEIGGKQVEAELLPADKARRIYEDIVRQMKDPALLEYAGRDVFKVRVFPIEPNSHKRITLSYSQVLPSDAGLVGYVYPLNTEKFSAKPIPNVSIKVELETKRSLKTIYSPSHAVEIKRHGPNQATIGYEAANVQPDTDFALYFAPEQEDVGLNLLTYKTPGEDGYFLLLASPGMDAMERQVVLKDVVFVLDTSGSMAGKKIQQARKALEFCVDNLNDGDHFELVRFSTEVEPLFDHLVDASPANRAKAQDFIKDLRANGATAIDDALRKALSLRPADSARPFVIIFLTDGMPTIGVTDEDQILANVKQNDPGRTRIFCFGIGTDVNTHLLDKLTEQSRGYSQYVLPEEDLEVKVSSFFAKIKEPVLANPTLKFGGDIRATKLYPYSLPDLFKGEQLVLAGRYSGHGNSAITIEGTVNGATRKYTYEVSFPEESSDHEFIPRLWATRRVGNLLDEIRLHGENAELRDEVTELARKYGIVTPYAAYLIVEDEDRRGVAENMRSLQKMDKDRTVREEAAKSWHSLNRATDGSSAIGGAQLNDSLKNAPAASVTVNGSAGEIYSRRSLGLPAAPNPAAPPALQAREKLVQYSQQTRFVNGRNFFQNGNQWTDSEVQKHQSAKHTRIQFNSPDYFALAAKSPQALPWLALGQNIQFVLNGIVYEIYE